MSVQLRSGLKWWIMASFVIGTYLQLFTQPVVLVASTFDVDDENWLYVTAIGYSAPPQWDATGRHPGGFVWEQDPDAGTFGFGAPSEFLEGLETDISGLDSLQQVIPRTGNISRFYCILSIRCTTPTLS